MCQSKLEHAKSKIKFRLLLMFLYFILQIALRAAFLEKENSSLKDEVKKVTVENKRLAAEKEALQQQLKALQQK